MIKAKIIVDAITYTYESLVSDQAIRLCAQDAMSRGWMPWEIILHTDSDIPISAIRNELRRLIEADHKTDQLLFLGEIERLIKGE